jgi:fatty acid desaturase
MKAPFPLLALIAFLLMPLVATMDLFELPFLPHFGIGAMLLLYICGGVLGTWLFDYTPHHPASPQRERHAFLRGRFFKG